MFKRIWAKVSTHCAYILSWLHCNRWWWLTLTVSRTNKTLSISIRFSSALQMCASFDHRSRCSANKFFTSKRQMWLCLLCNHNKRKKIDVISSLPSPTHFQWLWSAFRLLLLPMNRQSTQHMKKPQAKRSEEQNQNGKRWDEIERFVKFLFRNRKTKRCMHRKQTDDLNQLKKKNILFFFSFGIAMCEISASKSNCDHFEQIITEKRVRNRFDYLTNVFFVRFVSWFCCWFDWRKCRIYESIEKKVFYLLLFSSRKAENSVIFVRFFSLDLAMKSKN